MEYFFNNCTGAYRIALGKALSEIQVQRRARDGSLTAATVPLFFAPKLHWYVSRYASLPTDYEVKTVLPRVTYSMDGLSPAPDRQLNRLSKLEAPPELATEVKRWSLQATPYDFKFTFSIWAKRAGDVYQILEQLLQKFNPSMNLHVKEVPVFGAWRNCRVRLDDVSSSTTTDFDIRGDRVTKFDVGMTLEGHLYPAIRNSKLIQYITVNMYLTDDSLEGGEEESFEVEVTGT